MRVFHPKKSPQNEKGKVSCCRCLILVSQLRGNRAIFKKGFFLSSQGLAGSLNTQDSHPLRGMIRTRQLLGTLHLRFVAFMLSPTDSNHFFYFFRIFFTPAPADGFNIFNQPASLTICNYPGFLTDSNTVTKFSPDAKDAKVQREAGKGDFCSSLPAPTALSVAVYIQLKFWWSKVVFGHSKLTFKILSKWNGERREKSDF